MQQNEYQNTEQVIADRRILNSDPRETREAGGLHAKSQTQPRRGSAWRTLVLCLLALGLTVGILGLTGGFSFTSIQKPLPTRTFAIAGHGSLIINDGSGTFHIHEGSTNQIIIQGNEYAYGLINNLNDMHVQYAQQGNTVTLNAIEGWHIFGQSGVNFDITVPANLDVTIHGGSTNADVRNIDGRVTANVGSGDLHLNGINGGLSVSDGSGNIVVTGARGLMSAHTSSGDIQASDLSGSVDFSTDSGNITLDHAHLSGQGQLQTSSGDIRFTGDLDARSTYQMSTASGNITLNLPANASFQLSASTDSGVVNNSFASSSVGSTPHAALTLKTASGDINLLKQ